MQLFEQVHKALREDDADRVRKILESHPELKSRINEPIGPFDSPAIINVRSCQMVDVLLAAGADINARSSWWAGGFGILHCVSPDVAAHAIERGAIVDVHAASRLDMLDRLRSLIESNASLVNSRGGDGLTPLHFAASVAVAKCLLEHGAEIDVKDVDHESTPAQYMVKDRQEVARFLVQRGCKTDLLMAVALGDLDLVREHLQADPECVRMRVTSQFFPMTDKRAGGTIYQWTLGPNASAHQIAKKHGHEEIFQLLWERSPADVRLLAACWLGDAHTVKGILSADPVIASRLTDADKLQVMLAARDKQTAAVKLMLEAGLPVDAHGSNHATPLHWAAYHGNKEMAEAVLAHGPPLEMEDGDFHLPPLGWAIYGSQAGWCRETGDYPGTVEALLKAGARLPEQLGGSKAVLEVLRRCGTANQDEEESSKKS